MMGIPNIIPVEEDETMKLIDLDALCEEIENGKDKPKIYDGAGEADWINSCMEKAPVAYDLDKVVEQLEESKHNALILVGYEKSHGSVDDRMKAEGEVKALKYALEVMKGGGVNE